MRQGLALAVALLAAAGAHAQRPVSDATPARQFEEAVTLVDSRNDCAAAVPAVRARRERGRALARGTGARVPRRLLRAARQ